MVNGHLKSSMAAKSCEFVRFVDLERRFNGVIVQVSGTLTCWVVMILFIFGISFFYLVTHTLSYLYPINNYHIIISINILYDCKFQTLI